MHICISIPQKLASKKLEKKVLPHDEDEESSKLAEWAHRVHSIWASTCTDLRQLYLLQLCAQLRFEGEGLLPKSLPQCVEEKSEFAYWNLILAKKITTTHPQFGLFSNPIVFWSRGKRRAFSPRATARQSQSARVHSEIEKICSAKPDMRWACLQLKVYDLTRLFRMTGDISARGCNCWISLRPWPISVSLMVSGKRKIEGASSLEAGVSRIMGAYSARQ